MKTNCRVVTYMAGTRYSSSYIYFNTEEDAKDFLLTLRGWISFTGAFVSKRLNSNGYEIFFPKPIILPGDITIKEDKQK